jgi:hypothetical protein
MQRRPKKTKKTKKPKPKRRPGKTKLKMPAKSGLVKVPLVMGSKFKQRSGLTKPFEIIREEFLGEFKYNNVVDMIPINAGNSDMFPWLSGLAPSFEYYHFKSLEIEIRAVQSANVSGKYYMTVDYDAKDSKLADIPTLMNYAGAQSNPIWDPITLMRVIQKKPLYVLSGTQPADTDIRLYNVGNFNYVALAPSLTVDEDAMFEVTLRYRCHLITPKKTSLTPAPAPPPEDLRLEDFSEVIFGRRGGDLPEFSTATPGHQSPGLIIEYKNDFGSSIQTITIKNFRRYFSTGANAIAINLTFCSEDDFQVAENPLMPPYALLDSSANITVEDPSLTIYPCTSGLTPYNYVAQARMAALDDFYLTGGGAFGTLKRIIIYEFSPDGTDCYISLEWGGMAALNNSTPGNVYGYFTFSPVQIVGDMKSSLPVRKGMLRCLRSFGHKKIVKLPRVDPTRKGSDQDMVMVDSKDKT